MRNAGMHSFMRPLFLALFIFAAAIPPSTATLYCAGVPVATTPYPAAKLAQSSRTGTRHAIALFARFGDQTSPDAPPAWSADLFDPERAGSFAHFYDTMSFGKLRVRGEVAQKVYTAPDRTATYLAPSSTEPGQFARFTLEILQRADADIDFSRFDNDGPDGLANSGDDDGYVDALFIVLPSIPARFLVGNATGIGHLGLTADFYTDDLDRENRPIRIRSGLGTIQQGRTFSEAVGIMCHEYGHVLGLPDLFNTEFLQSEELRSPADDSAGIGRWGLMGWGALGWNDNDGPASFSAWSRLRLGWATLQEITTTGPMPGLEAVGQRGLIYQLSLTAREYFLLEHRTRASSYYDRNIPADGLLVWHVENVLPSGEHPFHTRVDLECADGLYRDAGYPLGTEPDAKNGSDNLDFWAHDSAYTLAHHGNLGDATDPFDGVRFTSFTSETNPSATGNNTHRNVRLDSIRIADGLVHAHVEVAPLQIGFFNLRYEDADDDDVLVTDEKATVRFRLTNDGGSDVENLRVRISSPDSLVAIDQEEAHFPSLRAGARSTGAGEIGFPQFRVKEGFTASHTTALNIEVFTNGELVAQDTLQVLALVPSSLPVRPIVRDPLGNGDGLLQIGEFFHVDVEFDIEYPHLLAPFIFHLRSLDNTNVQLQGSSQVRFDSTQFAHSIESPEFLLATELAPGDTIAFVLETRGKTVSWNDTLYLPISAGPDRTPPRINRPIVRLAGADRKIHLVASQIRESDSIDKVHVEIFSLRDTTFVDAIDLFISDSGYTGLWRSPAPDAYLLQTVAEDRSGNIGRSAFYPISVFARETTATNYEESWEAIDLPAPKESAALLDLFFAPNSPDVLYARSYRSSTWRSDDGGTNWQRLDLMTGANIFIDAGNPHHIFAKGDFSRFAPLYSEDGGHTWRALETVDLTLRATDPIIPGKLYATRSSKLAISEDSGATWRDEPIRASWVAPHPSSPDVLYAGILMQAGMGGPEGITRLPGEISRSEDGGRSWQTHTQSRYFNTVALAPQDPLALYATKEDSIFYSRDGGQSWGFVYTFNVDTSYFGLSLHPENPEIIIAWNGGYNSAPYRSEDGGRSWTRQPLPATSTVQRLHQHPHHPHRLYVITNGFGTGDALGTLYLSTDDGETWELLNRPQVAPSIGALAADNRGQILALSSTNQKGYLYPRIYTSPNGSDQWQLRDGNTSIIIPTYLDPVGTLLVDPIDENILTVNIGYASMRSADSGQSWKNLFDLSRGYFNVTPVLISHPQKQNVYYFAGRNFSYSIDRGLNWTDRSAGLPTRQVGTTIQTEPLLALAADPKEQGTLLASSSQSIWRSDDEGLHWREISNLYAFALAFHPLRPRELYAVSPQGLHRSLDYGVNWSLLVGLAQSGYTSTRLRFAPHDPDRFYLAAGPDLLETRDGGQTWDAIGTDLAAYPWFNDVAVDPLQPQFLYAATPWGLYRSDRSTPRTHIEEEQQNLPNAFALAQNYPNPFNPSTAIRYQTPQSGFAELTIYNLTGQVVRNLVREEKTGGAYETIWDGRNNEGVQVGSGVYFYRLRVGKQVLTRRMLLLK